ncbi:MAG: hypothetical protein IKV82_04760 [Akkermansia sp.]|nr:hypothetical protein [Akkermansia sp.]
MLIKSLQTAEYLLNKIEQNWDIAHFSIQEQIDRCKCSLKMSDNMSDGYSPELGVSCLTNTIRHLVYQIKAEDENCNKLNEKIRALSSRITDSTSDLQDLLTCIEKESCGKIQSLPIVRLKEHQSSTDISDVEGGKQILLDKLTEITLRISKEFRAAYKKAYALERELKKIRNMQIEQGNI